ncbi:UNVERIFIED_CONTAM: hypothetical protein H355_005733 [Colinus virginianus]|nr:hypothetical protein H355_005733 [Colinus virginianus]
MAGGFPDPVGPELPVTQDLGNVVLLSGARLVTQLSELIRVRDGDTDSNGSTEKEDEAEDTEFIRFFPGFVWVVRDFTLELRVGERPISEDEYLEQALQLKHGECWPHWGHQGGTNGRRHHQQLCASTGHGRKVQIYNGTRQCLRNYFSTRKCFVLPPPLGTEEHGRLEELPETALAPRFLQQAAKFCDYVLGSTRPKVLPDGGALTGRGKEGEDGKDGKEEKGCDRDHCNIRQQGDNTGDGRTMRKGHNGNTVQHRHNGETEWRDNRMTAVTQDNDDTGNNRGTVAKQETAKEQL